MSNIIFIDDTSNIKKVILGGQTNGKSEDKNADEVPI